MPPPVMRSSFASSRQSRDSKGRKLKLSQRGDPEKRPILTRIYGMIGCLIVSLVLIVILIILQKKLPDGAGSYFHIPVRRDLEAISARESAQRQEDGSRMERRAIAVPRQLEPRITPIFTINPIRLSEFFPITPTPTPTPGANCISGTSYEVDCTTQEIIAKMAKRQKSQTWCSTTTLGDCPWSLTTAAPSRITPPPVWASEIPINSCSTLLEGCTYTLENVDVGSTYTCISTVVTKKDCYLTTTTPPPSSVTGPPLTIITVNPCTIIADGCTTMTNDAGSPVPTCYNTTISRRGCRISTAPPPTSMSSNSCVATSTSCTTAGNIDRGFVVSCSDSYSTISGCGSTTTPPPTTVSSNSCVATSTSCTTTGNVDSGFGVSCSDSYSTISGCGSTTTPPTTSVSSNSCVGTSLSCTVLETDSFCSTIYTTIPGCGSTSTSSSSSKFPTSSSSTIPSSSSSTVSSTAPPASSTSSTVPTSSSSLSPSSSSSSISSSSSSGSASVVVGPVSITTNSSTSSSSFPTGSSSSSGSVVVRPISITTNVSSSSLASTSFSSPPTGPSSSLPTSSSSSPATVGRPVSLSSSSTTSSPAASTPAVIISSSSSISPGSISTTASGTPGSSSSGPPVLVVALPSGSTSSSTSGSTSASFPPASPSLSSPSFSGSTSVSPVIKVSGSPASLSSPSGSSSPLPLLGALKLPSSTPSTTTPNFPPSTLVTVPSGSSLPSASSPTGPGTTVSGSPTSSPVSASSDLLQSINASGSLAPSKTAAGGGGGGGGGGSPSQTDDPKKIHAIPDIWPITQTILGDYTPLVVSRGFLMLLKAFYEQLLTWEPIRQLLTPGGGSLVDSSVLTPIRIAIISAHIGTAFSAGLTFFDTGYCSSTELNAIGICPPRLSVNPAIVDVVIVTLVIQVLTIIYVISQWWKKPGGFSADPTSVAGIAAFMGHPEIEQEFVSIPTEITYAGLKRRLKGKKFRLGQFATERGIVKYGIMPVDDEGKDARKKDGVFSKIGNGWSNFLGKFTFLHNWKTNRHMFDIVFVMFLIALLGLTIDAVSRINQSQVVFLATASVHGTGWRIFTTIMGVIVSYFWGQFFQDAQTFAPYIDLARGSSDPGSTILLRRHSIPLTAFFPLLWHCHYTPALVAFIGLIAEILIVALSGLPYRPGQSRGEFLFWGITSLAILTIMITMLTIVFFWRRKLPHLPRAPESIAAVMTYVAGTSMTRDFNGLEQLKRKERDQAIKDLEKTYAYWWRREEDGRIRWVVDVVPGEKNNRALMDGASDFS